MIACHEVLLWYVFRTYVFLSATATTYVSFAKCMYTLPLQRTSKNNINFS
jgi:hypothetical protein